MVNRFVVVDEKDNIIGSESKDIIRKKKLKYRVSALWIKNSKEESLLARRAYTKKNYPGRWGPAVSGTVEEGESYEDNLIKETKEELGLNDIKIEMGPQIEVIQDNHFTQWFFSTIDKPANEFKIQEDEVVEVRWFSKARLKEELKNNPEEFLVNMDKYAELFC